MAATPSGKDKVERYARIYVGGYDLSGDARTFSSLDNNFGEVDFTGWSESVRNYLSNGHRIVGIRGFQALVNDTSGRAFDQLKSAENSSQVSLLFGGGGAPAPGDPAYVLPSVQMSDTANFDSGAGMITADFIPEASQMSANYDNPMGVVLADSTSISATTNYTSSDFGAQTTAGWSANLHVTATSLGNFAIVIEDSADDSVWATLGTFTSTAGSVESEFLSGSGTVDRYVRITATRTAGTVTIIVTFARN